MACSTVKELLEHISCNIEIAYYGEKDNPDSVTLECSDHGMVLYEFESGQCPPDFTISQLIAHADCNIELDTYGPNTDSVSVTLNCIDHRSMLYDFGAIEGVQKQGADFEVFVNPRKMPPADLEGEHQCDFCPSFSTRIVQIPGTGQLLCGTCLSRMQKAINQSYLNEFKENIRPKIIR